MRYSSVKARLTVFPLPPSFSPQLRVHPRPPIPIFALPTTHRSLPTLPRPLFSHTYESPLPTHRFVSRLFPSTSESLFPQTLCFEKHLRCPIVFSARPPKPTPLYPEAQSRGANSLNMPLTPFLAYCCGLFAAHRKLNSFAIKEIQTLSENTRGGVQA